MLLQGYGIYTQVYFWIIIHFVYNMIYLMVEGILSRSHRFKSLLLLWKFVYIAHDTQCTRLQFGQFIFADGSTTKECALTELWLLNIFIHLVVCHKQRTIVIVRTKIKE